MHFLLLFQLLVMARGDDPDRELTTCEVCKFLAVELSDNLRDYNSTGKIQLSYSLDNMDKRTIPYQTSETRLTEVLDSVCARILDYNVHAERSGSNRYAKGRSETMSSLWTLRFAKPIRQLSLSLSHRNRGVKVVLDVPEDKWDYPSAEITNLEKACNMMVEENEDDIRHWYFSQHNDSLKKYLCEDRVLLNGNQKVFVPKPKEESDDEDEKDSVPTKESNETESEPAEQAASDEEKMDGDGSRDDSDEETDQEYNHSEL